MNVESRPDPVRPRRIRATSSRRPRATGPDDALAARLAEAARVLQDEPGLDATLDGIVRCAVGTVPGAWHAAITEVEGRHRVVTSAATGNLVRRVDQAQYDTGQGPCLTALFEHRTVRMPDVAAETRWPEFVRRIDGLGVRSMLSFQLYLARDSLGALNLYAREPGAFTDESERVGVLFAAHAAVAMGNARKLAQLSQALDVRDLIGQAKGILMERHRLTGEQAFALLVRASQRLNVKLLDVARDLIETGELVDVP
ncbi:ANTAR domain-containing protein [Micromonospora carbonacea]|uniref:GAF and ANTAR domain-containing protein n=1 Tax=Micromonospora TaxID=1873 RepID=UPI002416DABD|nr:GAF and ANTAR domain-containing protein [Micromonospora sp. WMMD956]MDG4816905.1 GAF and ANTAR domain-containing protein [Micromonospora sp. WMMD956]